MRILELFSGTGSIGNIFRRNGHEVISVDLDGRFGAEIQEDILIFNYARLETPDFIWASPDCREYNRAKTIGVRKLDYADSLVAKTLEIIRYFEKLNPRLLWMIENGDSTLLWEL